MRRRRLWQIQLCMNCWHCWTPFVPVAAVNERWHKRCCLNDWVCHVRRDEPIAQDQRWLSNQHKRKNSRPNIAKSNISIVFS